MSDLSVALWEIERVICKLDEIPPSDIASDARVDNLTAALLAVSKQLAEVGSQQDLVAWFHRKFDLSLPGRPSVPSDSRVRLRLKLKIEECFEFVEACVNQHSNEGSMLRAYRDASLDALECAPIEVDFPAAIKELTDCVYIDLGTAIEFGVDLDEPFRLTHESNMAKEGGSTREDGKVLKPPGWTPPDIAGELKKQGWEG